MSPPLIAEDLSLACVASLGTFGGNNDFSGVGLGYFDNGAGDDVVEAVSESIDDGEIGEEILGGFIHGFDIESLDTGIRSSLYIKLLLL